MALLLDADEEEIDHAVVKKRSIWVHDILKKRKVEGEHATLCKELEDYEEKFFKYFRMSKYQFNVLLLKIESNISKQNTHFRETIPPKQKLAVCLW
jgi:hypothetical protein